jgi:hypothetical protein
MKKELTLRNIRAAREEVSAAEAELAKLVAEIEVAVRARKTTASDAFKVAFAKLRAARLHLVILEKVAEDELDDDK